MKIYNTKYAHILSITSDKKNLGVSPNDALWLVEKTLLSISEAEGVAEFKLTKFQDRAIRKALLSSWSGQRESAMIICSGTGSGKTIGFTVPVLVDAVLDTLRRDSPEELTNEGLALEALLKKNLEDLFTGPACQGSC